MCVSDVSIQKHQRKANVADKSEKKTACLVFLCKRSSAAHKESIVITQTQTHTATFVVGAVETEHMQTEQDPNLLRHNTTDGCFLPSWHQSIWIQRSLAG